MSRIGELIAELCPDGVPHRRLSDVARIRNGRDYKQLAVGDIPVYGTGGVMTRVDSAAHQGPSVLILRKGSLSKLYYVDEPFWTVDTIFYTEIDHMQMVPKFLYYYLATQRLEELNQAGGVPSLTQKVLNAVRIPVPPLVVQREIVRILDLFTTLEAELEAELEARRRQYAHYRDSLLSFPEGGVQWLPMGELAQIGTGSSDRIHATDDGAYPFYVRSKDVLRISEWEFDEEAVLIPGEGGIGEIFHYVSGRYGLHQRAYRVHLADARVSAKFLYHVLAATFRKYITSRAVSATVTSIRKPMLQSFPVPIPSLDEQARIVTILDAFDALVNDLSIGLPAELAARRKQYEYYRDRLLTFKEADA